MGYAESRYYEVIGEAIDKYCDGSITKAEYSKIRFEAFENELAHPEIYSDWLVHHFNSTAEALMEADRDTDPDDFVSMVDDSVKEIELFRKYGHENIANELAGWTADAVEHYLKLLAAG